MAKFGGGRDKPSSGGIGFGVAAAGDPKAVEAARPDRGQALPNAFGVGAAKPAASEPVSASSSAASVNSPTGRNPNAAALLSDVLLSSSLNPTASQILLGG